MNFSDRTINVLKKNGIDTLEKLQNLTKDEFIKLRGLGRMSTEEILQFMRDLHIEFKESEDN